MSTYEEQIKQMYGSQLNSQKEQLKTDYDQAVSELDKQIAEAQKKTDRNIRQTQVDAKQAAVNTAEYYAANGLTSGAKAQARLAQETQLQDDINTLRATQQAADAEVERQRGLLAQEYTSAIRKAQADNDLALAQALYEAAKEEEAKLLAKQEAAAGLMAQSGDYSRYGELYGLSDEEVKKLNKASTGSGGGGGGGNVDPYAGKANNGSVDSENIKKLQDLLGVDADGRWGPKTRKEADKLWGTTDPDEAWELMKDEVEPSTVKWTDQWGTVEFSNPNVKGLLDELKRMQAAGERQWDRRALLYEAYKNDGLLTKEEYMAMFQRA